jgi:hypothetical protein
MILEVVKSDRTVVYTGLTKARQPELAKLIRRL